MSKLLASYGAHVNLYLYNGWSMDCNPSYDWINRGSPFAHTLPFNSLLLFIFMILTSLSDFLFCSAVRESGSTPISNSVSSKYFYSLNITTIFLLPNIVYPLSYNIWLCAPGASCTGSNMECTAILFRFFLAVILSYIFIPNVWAPYWFPSMMSHTEKECFYNFQTFLN